MLEGTRTCKRRRSLRSCNAARQQLRSALRYPPRHYALAAKARCTVRTAKRPQPLRSSEGTSFPCLRAASGLFQADVIVLASNPAGSSAPAPPALQAGGNLRLCLEALQAALFGSLRPQALRARRLPRAPQLLPCA